MFIIETMYRPTEFSCVWVSDSIGENEPRSREECEADVAAFRRGDCGPDMAPGFAEDLEGKEWRIVESGG
jgi:hypothetical protein